MKKRSKRHQRRHTVADRDGWGCAYCGTATECGHGRCNPGTPVPATLDHVVPKAAGGTGRLTNLVVACGPCNHAKSTALDWVLATGETQAAALVTGQERAG